MTIKELYNKAVALGYEDAQIGIDVTMRDKTNQVTYDLYDDLFTIEEVDFGGLYEGMKKVDKCIWIYIETEGRLA